MYIFRFKNMGNCVEKAQFTRVCYFVTPHFETIINAAIAEKMLRASFE